MILTRLAAIVAVLLAIAVPCIRGTLMVRDARRRSGSPASIRGTLMVRDARRRSGSPAPRTQEQ